MKLYARLAQLIVARANCQRTNNTEWLEKHTDTLEQLVKDRLVLTTAFHHMNDGGMYDGWTEHTITVRPSLAFDFNLTISGRDRNGIKEYLADCYRHDLDQSVD